MRVRLTTSVCAGLVAMMCLTGCPPKKKLTLDEKKTDQTQEAKAPAAGTTINTDWTDVPQLADVHFDVDKANLDETARQTLKNNLSFLKKLPSSVTVRVAGYCDSRGTVEYNIALGQRRADAVRSYYLTAGISRARVETISFGRERPLCQDETESCWSRNRRTATSVKSPKPLTILPDSASVYAPAEHPQE